MNYEKIIKEILKDNYKNMILVSETNNKVFKVETINNQILYAKFYQQNSTHIDNELKIYNILDNKYLKEIYYKSNDNSFAIFKELIGKTIDCLTPTELNDYCQIIIESLYNYFESIKNIKVKNYGILDKNLNGIYKDFYTFLNERQQQTSEILKEYKEFNQIYNKIIKKYINIIKPDNSLVPIDTNLKNIILLNDNTIKFSDPGEMISGPILMAYGDFAAHTYKTVLYDTLIKKLNLNNTEEKLLRIYAIFSSLNILAFLKNNGVNNLKKIIPYGNTFTFYELIQEHLSYLNIE